MLTKPPAGGLKSRFKLAAAVCRPTAVPRHANTTAVRCRTHKPCKYLKHKAPRPLAPACCPAHGATKLRAPARGCPACCRLSHGQDDASEKAQQQAPQHGGIDRQASEQESENPDDFNNRRDSLVPLAPAVGLEHSACTYALAQVLFSPTCQAKEQWASIIRSIADSMPVSDFKMPDCHQVEAC